MKLNTMIIQRNDVTLTLQQTYDALSEHPFNFVGIVLGDAGTQFVF